MDFNHNNKDNDNCNINKNKNFINIEKFSYLYPDGHRITHQMRWFKSSSVRNSSSYIAL